jgi:hypothetical protein
MKYKLSLLLIPALLITNLYFIAPKTKAWSGNLPTCNVGNALDWTWKDKIVEKDPNYNIDTWTGTVLIATFDNFGEYPAGYTSTKYDLGVYFGYNGEFRESSGNRTFYMANTQRFAISKDTQNPNYKSDVIKDNFTTTLNTGTFACIITAKNVIYTSQYTGTIYSDALPNQQNQCDGLDIGCYIKSAIDSVNNTIRDVAIAVINLFIPTGEQVKTEFSRLMTFYTDKLGFLTYPAIVFADIADALTNSNNGWCTSSSCNLNLGQFYGSNLNINLLAVQQLNQQLWTFALFIIRTGTIIWLVQKLHEEYMELVKQ